MTTRKRKRSRHIDPSTGAIVTSGGLEIDYGPSLHAPKYRYAPTQSETEQLTQLVETYGRDVIARAVNEIAVAIADKNETRSRPRDRGRPSSSPYENLHLLDWFEERVEEHRQARRPTPIKDAQWDMYNVLFNFRVGDLVAEELPAWRSPPPDEEQPPAFDTFRRSLKRRLQRARKVRRELASKSNAR